VNLPEYLDVIELRKEMQGTNAQFFERQDVMPEEKRRG
jgi:hypothetical protein